MELQRLIKGGMYELIQTLIASNCLFTADARTMDVDDLFAAQQIQDRALPSATEFGAPGGGGGGPRGGGTPLPTNPAQAKGSPRLPGEGYEGGEADQAKTGAANENGGGDGGGAGTL